MHSMSARYVFINENAIYLAVLGAICSAFAERDMRLRRVVILLCEPKSLSFSHFVFVAVGTATLAGATGARFAGEQALRLASLGF